MDWNAQITTYLQKTGLPPAASSDVIAMLGSACQAAVERQIARTFDNIEYTEAYNGNGRRTLFLQHDPVVSIGSLSISGAPQTIVDPTALAYPSATATIAPTRQGILLTDGCFTYGVQNVLVTYTAGLTDPGEGVPPNDIVLAVTYWAASFFRGRDRVGINSVTVNGQITQFAQDIPKDVKMMITAWRRALLPC